MEKQKLIVILGPTTSGKTDLSVTLAKKYNGEIISADSRQVYKGLKIGSGKITRTEMRGVPHHLLDVANPKKRFTVAQYQKLALKAIKQTQERGKIPFLVGGTGFYIQSIVDGIAIPEVSPNWKLRKKLEAKSVEQLFVILKKLDPVRAANIDPKNPRRLVRAIEINLGTGSPVPKLSHEALGETREFPALPGFPSAKWDILQIGIKKSPQELKKLIQARLQKRAKGIIAEVKKLHQNRLSWKRLEELGLEYRFVARLQRYAQHCGQAQYKIAYQDMLEKLPKEIEHFAKRQMTWFKRDQRIHWVKNQREAEKLIKKFLQIKNQPKKRLA